MCIKLKGVLLIEEVNGDYGLNWEEIVVCIIEEDYILFYFESRFLLCLLKVSFECMILFGYFLVNSDVLYLEDVLLLRFSNIAFYLIFV